jgi:hypothetical protein
MAAIQCVSNITFVLRDLLLLEAVVILDLACKCILAV